MRDSSANHSNGHVRLAGPCAGHTGHVDDDDLPAEGDREWREVTQQTNELAEELQPPHDPSVERGDPSPSDPGAD